MPASKPAGSLSRSDARKPGTGHTARSRSIEIAVETDSVTLHGTLEVPPQASGIVVFAHGSGSSRQSPRNQYVAQVLRQRGIGTVLVDLLSAREEEIDRLTGHLRFDIPMLAARLQTIGEWVLANENPRALGYFGASTGAAAALIAAASQGPWVTAVVSRGGRPDLAGAALRRVLAPTLLIVGSNDVDVLALNRNALARLNAHSQLKVIAGATHLFEEPGTLKAAATAAADWFGDYLVPMREQAAAVSRRSIL